jgi:hypothetical protein
VSVGPSGLGNAPAPTPTTSIPQAVLDNYEKLSPEIQAELPLKRVSQVSNVGLGEVNGGICLRPQTVL